MPKACPICQHSKRQAIEKAILDKVELHQIAEQFNVSQRSLFNHKKNHLPGALVKARDAKEVNRGDTLLKQIKYLQARALTILRTAEASGTLKTALMAIREARGNLELVTRIMFEAALEERIAELERKKLK